MILRKKKIGILVIIIVLIVLIILGILGILYLKTDMFKSNETLFAKYMMQNLNAVEMLKDEDSLEIKNKLNTNKYTSEIEGKIQYTENIGTSDENKDNSINKIGIKINSNIDKTNNYDYKDISIGTEDNDLVKLEYLNQDQTYGIRLKGIKQFVSIENDGENEILKEYGIENIQGLLDDIDFNSIISFTEEEKQSLIDTYVGTIQSNVSKDKYYKQPKTLITINNKDVQTNAYYMKLTVEEYNNLCIKILEQIIKDEVILSKIDIVENEIKEKYSNYGQTESLRETFINYINEKIEEIKDNNIGNEEVKIIVYENNMQTVRTSVEKSIYKMTLDLYNNSYMKFDNIELGETTNEQFIEIEKNNSETQTSTLIETKKIQDSEIVNNIKLNYQQIIENEKINKNIELEVSNEKYKGVLNIEDNIEFVGEFENQITLDIDNVKLNELDEDKIKSVKKILDENMQGQLSDLSSVVNLNEYTKMLQNLGIIKKNSVQIPEENEVTDVERKRFNSQFEFFISEDLTKDNIKDLIKTLENNFDDMKVLLKNGEIEDLDIEKMDSSYSDSGNYKENISEILISIKEDSTNEEKKENVLKFIEDNSSDKYTVSLEYDDDGLAKIIRIKIQKED
ncbi:MAG: hypothetical protein IJE05_01445 [Clostridia bacterium]|nr:hypothetical protein [Clostridia bacterium]